MTAPQINAGDIGNWPILKITYRTDAEKIADLLPPGIEPGAEPRVHLNVYNVPVPDVPEYGILITVETDPEVSRCAVIRNAGKSGSGRSVAVDAALFEPGCAAGGKIGTATEPGLRLSEPPWLLGEKLVKSALYWLL